MEGPSVNRLEQMEEAFLSSSLLLVSGRAWSLCINAHQGWSSSSAATHLHDLLWCCGFSQNVVSKYLEPKWGGKGLPAQGHPGSNKEEFSCYPLPWLFIPDLTRPNVTHLYHSCCASYTSGKLGHREAIFPPKNQHRNVFRAFETRYLW